MFKKVIVLLATILLLGLIAACGSAATPQTVTVVETVVVTVLVEKGQVTANNSFSYPVRVQAKGTGEHIPDAKITIEVIGKAPLDEVTDANGFARVFIDADRAGQPSKLIVQATGYKQYIQNIDLTEGNLPDVVQLESASSDETASDTKSTETTITAEPSLEPTATPVPPTETPQPTYTPRPTLIPTPSLALPFEDNFNNGPRAEWRIIKGEPIITNGQLGAGVDSVTLQIGDDALSDYTVSFTFYGVYNGEIHPVIAQKMRFEFDWYNSSWEAFQDNKWVQIGKFEHITGSERRLSITTTANTYKVYLDGSLHSEIIYGSALQGPFSITIDKSAFIDDFVIAKP